MTRPNAIVSGALATAAINIVVALAVIAAVPAETVRPEMQTQHSTAPLFQASPIPAGADWGRS